MMLKVIDFLRTKPEGGAILIAILMAVVFTVTSNGVWLSVGNMQSVFQVTAILAVMAFGQAYVITVGEIDISVGSVFGVTALTYLGLTGGLGWSVMLAIPVSLLVAMTIGLFNGILVNQLNIPSLIATLGTLFIFRGIAYALTENFSFGASYEMKETIGYKVFGGTEFLGLNTGVWWGLGILITLHVILFYTPFGNRILATGGHGASALSRGVRTNRLKIKAFVLCSLMAGCAAILEANKIGYADGSFGRLMELEAIAASVLGGCLLAGGRSSIVGTLCGAFILSSIQSYLVVKGIQPQWFMLLLGAIVVLASFSNTKLSQMVKV